MKRFTLGSFAVAGLSCLVGCGDSNARVAEATPTPTPDYIAGIRTYSNGGIALTSNDFDGDGDVDVIAASSYNGALYLYVNDGKGNFTLKRPN